MRISPITEKLNARALKTMPGGHSNLKIPVGVQPMFMTRGRGSRLWDADGNEYIDFMCGAGAGLLGYSNEAFLDDIKVRLDTLYYLVSGAAQTPLEVELAEKIIFHVPCAEKVRFCLSGTEAVQLVIRLARAYTGRPYFIRFEGHYHGWLDNVIGGMVNDRVSGPPFAVEGETDPLGTKGKSPWALRESFKLPWNDIEVLENVLAAYGEEVALIHMEPIMCNAGGCHPKPGYLERVRELCDRYGIILSFDEIITGFRVGLSGAQGLTGVTPDLATFGKAMAGGLPLSAVVGKQEIMDLLTRREVIGAGTFNGYPLGVAAALSTLKFLERDDGAFYQKIDRQQARLHEGLKSIAEHLGIPVLLQGPRGVFLQLFTDRGEVSSARDLKDLDLEKQNRFRSYLVEQGVLIMWGGRWYICDGLTDMDVDEALEKAEKAMRRLKS